MYESLLDLLNNGNSQKRKVFVSYHHALDQSYYDAFKQCFDQQYDVITDNSLDRRIDSSNHQYILRKIREEYIKGSSCTIVLCGAETYKRKYVDWEIKATLDKQHGLLGVVLPTKPDSNLFQLYYPHRLVDNVVSGYAVVCNWNDLTRDHLRTFIERANGNSKSLIVNNRELKSQNG